MGRAIRRIIDAAATQRFLITRDEILDLGGSDDLIIHRLNSSAWTQVHPGVYQVDRRPLNWESLVLAAIFAAGPDAVASHRAALKLWELEGIGAAPVEITMSFGNLAVPQGVVVHRSRRERQRSIVRDIPVTTVERTLLDCSSQLPTLIIGKALDSAIRKNLTTIESVYDLLVTKGGRGVRGTKRLRWVIQERLHDTATGSGSEYELLYHMQMAFLPRPELQYPLFPTNGRRVPDFYWPDKNKAVEVDGVDAHSSADQLDDDLKRQNDLLDMGIELRRFSAREVRRNPSLVVAQIRQFLEG